jgi:hypothetical protein
MKSVLLSLVLGLAVCATALGQGKIRFNNDSLHLVYFTTYTPDLAPQDVGLAGQAVPAGGQLPSNHQLVVDLYAGLSSSSLALVASTSFSGSTQPGTWVGANLILPTIPGGTLTYFQVFVHEISLVDAYLGWSVIFAGMTGSGTAYPSITSFWPVGDFPMDTYGPGSRGAIMVSILPEPGVLSFVLLGLGTWLARRRKI